MSSASQLPAAQVPMRSARASHEGIGAHSQHALKTAPSLPVPVHAQGRAVAGGYIIGGGPGGYQPMMPNGGRAGQQPFAMPQPRGPGPPPQQAPYAMSASGYATVLNQQQWAAALGASAVGGSGAVLSAEDVPSQTALLPTTSKKKKKAQQQQAQQQQAQQHHHHLQQHHHHQQQQQHHQHQQQQQQHHQQQHQQQSMPPPLPQQHMYQSPMTAVTYGAPLGQPLSAVLSAEAAFATALDAAYGLDGAELGTDDGAEMGTDDGAADLVRAASRFGTWAENTGQGRKPGQHTGPERLLTRLERIGLARTPAGHLMPECMPDCLPDGLPDCLPAGHMMPVLKTALGFGGPRMQPGMQAQGMQTGAVLGQAYGMQRQSGAGDSPAAQGAVAGVPQPRGGGGGHMIPGMPPRCCMVHPMGASCASCGASCGALGASDAMVGGAAGAGIGRAYSPFAEPSRLHLEIMDYAHSIAAEQEPMEKEVATILDSLRTVVSARWVGASAQVSAAECH